MAVRKLTKAEVEAAVRDVTDAEVEFYLEHGWVKLERLISPELAAELRRVGVELRTREPESYRYGLREDAQPFGWFEFSQTMCRNAARLINRTSLHEDGVPIRYGGDNFFVKPPGEAGAQFHQDSVEHGSDRVGETRFWVAVDHVTADMGPMCFIDGVHLDGPLGSIRALREGDHRDLLDFYPKLRERLTPPIEYAPGDVTVHHGYMAHGSGPNTTDRTRLSFLLNYVPADTRYINGTYSGNPGGDRTPLDDERHPIIFPRA